MWNITIKIDGKKIEPSSHVKYLGILIDSFLNWNFHIDELSTKLSHAVGMLANIRHFPWFIMEFFNPTSTGKSEGYDGIPNKMISSSPDILLDLLNKLMNICIDKSLVPNSWTLEHISTGD